MAGIRADFECPYCGHKNSIILPPKPYTENKHVYCGLDAGGCEGMVVITYKTSIDVQVHEIVGEKEALEKAVGGSHD